MPNPYKPVDCNFYDQLEAYATLRKKVLVQYLVAGAMIKSEPMVIKDFIAKNGQEYLVNEKGKKIRLDEIMGVSEM